MKSNGREGLALGVRSGLRALWQSFRAVGDIEGLLSEVPTLALLILLRPPAQSGHCLPRGVSLLHTHTDTHTQLKRRHRTAATNVELHKLSTGSTTIVAGQEDLNSGRKSLRLAYLLILYICMIHTQHTYALKYLCARYPRYRKNWYYWIQRNLCCSVCDHGYTICELWRTPPLYKHSAMLEELESEIIRKV